jgi:hypothetical protein
VQPLRGFLEKLAAIVGGIALFLGLFILLAGDHHSVGFWDQSWKVGEISEWWGIGLVAVGAALILAFVISVVARRR